MIEVYPAYTRIDDAPKSYRNDKLKATLEKMRVDARGSRTPLESLIETIIEADIRASEEVDASNTAQYLFGLSWGERPSPEMPANPYFTIIHCVATGMSPESKLPKLVNAQFWASSDAQDAYDDGWLSVLDKRGALHHALSDVLVLESEANRIPGWYLTVSDTTVIAVEGEQPYVFGERFAQEAIEDIEDMPPQLKEHLLGKVAAYYANLAQD